MLEQELELAKELTSKLRGKIADVEGREASAESKEIENNKRSKALNSAEDSIRERSQALAGAESAQSTLALAKEERLATDELNKSLAAREAEFAGKVSKHNEAVQILARDNQLIQDGNDLLKKREAELKEKEAKYKDEVLAKLKQAV